jgi:psp operon transcriptional activator
MHSQAPNIIGESPQLAAALDHISRLAAIDRSALIIGERGTGKELAAERLHYLSPRWDQTFTKINCSAIAETLLESELFGTRPGRLLGRQSSISGAFELTDGGTLFLDELATMSLRLQEKLLRVIEYGEFERVGGQKTLQVDVRLVAATNADLPSLADEGPVSLGLARSAQL